MPSSDDLHSALIAMASFLEEHDEAPYATEVQVAAGEVGRGDRSGADRYLELNKALLDIYFSPVNGNAASKAEGDALNDQLAKLHRRAWSLANTQLRSGGRS